VRIEVVGPAIGAIEVLGAIGAATVVVGFGVSAAIII
jgi:hypothetical protein